MKLPRITTILTDDSPGEFRAIAVDREGRAWRQFSQRWGGVDEPLRDGQSASAIVRSFDASQGGAFLALETGEDVFLAAKERGQLSDGQRLPIVCAAAARSGKLARVLVYDGDVTPFDAFTAWQASLATKSLDIKEDVDAVDAAFEDALAPQCQISSGGTIYIEPTRALTAIDIDSAGRIGRGSAGARALSLNRDAVSEAARQIALRDMGGTFVIDCVAPLNKASGGQVQDAFITTFKAVSQRRFRVLSVSKLDLLEVSVERGPCPLSDKLLNEAGALTPESKLLKILRQTKREFKAARSAFFTVGLSKSSHDAYLKRETAVEDILRNRFTGRVTLTRAEGTEDRIEKQ
ncbi:MAG: ribonuclease E/G [Henriciella sp.]|jgi:hypothetical protein